MPQVAPSRRKRGTGGWLDVNPHYNNQAATAITEMNIMWRGKIINVEARYMTCLLRDLWRQGMLHADHCCV